MSNKQVQTETSNSRRSISRNHYPARSNTIRGMSLNHNVNNQSLANSANIPFSNNNNKPAPKTLTVSFIIFSIISVKAITKASLKK